MLKHLVEMLRRWTISKEKSYHCFVDVTYTQGIYVDAKSQEEAVRAAKDEARDMHPNSLVLNKIEVFDAYVE